MKKTAKVAVIMGSRSDWPTMKKAVKILKEYGVTTEVDIISAHRTPERMQDYATTAADRGIAVIIAGAGGAAHLPGMVASLTWLPVIGVPIALHALEGIDSLLSILQMPRGVPVATVAIDNATNAGLLALRILAVSDEKLAQRLRRLKKSQAEKVLKDAAQARSRNKKHPIKKRR
jgi:phosphoribosylaminoimidazole carboxylase PurE protein